MNNNFKFLWIRKIYKGKIKERVEKQNIQLIEDLDIPQFEIEK